MSASRLEPAGDGRDVVVLPNLKRRADGQAVAVHGKAHRRGNARKWVLSVPWSLRRRTTSLPA